MKSTLGQLITDYSTPNRDAVHVHVIKASLASTIEEQAPLKPGQLVKLDSSEEDYWGVDQAYVLPCFEEDKDKAIGFVDPFLKDKVTKGTFWVIVFPDKVKNLTHDWAWLDEGERISLEDDGCVGRDC